MRPLLFLLITNALLPSPLSAQGAPQAPAADTTFYSVFYVEIMPSSRTAALAALKQYREASVKDEGHLRSGLFEQIGRTGHFVMIETWATQKAFDAHQSAPHTRQMLSQLQPIRLADYDQRPYKTLTVGSVPAPNDRTIYVITHVDVGGPQGSPSDLLKRLTEASRKETGNLRFDVMQNTMRANHFTVVEAWQNQKALDDHAAAAHTRQYRDGLQPLLGSPLDERLYKAVN